MIVLVCMLVVITDQLSKLIFSGILPLNSTIPLIKNFFHLTLVYNTGIAFGMLKGNSRPILIITIIGLALIIYSMKKDLLENSASLSKRKLWLLKIAIGFILGGAIGNMIDRIRFGYVIDFLDFRVWPVFNFADSFITIGAVVLFWILFMPVKKSTK